MKPKITRGVLDRVFANRKGFVKIQLDNLSYPIFSSTGELSAELVHAFEKPYIKIVLFYANDYYEDITSEIGRLEVELSSKDELYEQLVLFRTENQRLRDSLEYSEDLVWYSRG